MSNKETQHFLNPLHVYCRLRDLGFLPVNLCKRIVILYEKHIFNKLYNSK